MKQIFCKKNVIEYVCIVLGSLIYAFATVTFIFPHELLLGGTSGISVILTRFIGSSPSIILTIINGALLVLALLILGKSMALKTLVGSALTTVFIPLIELLIKLEAPLVGNPYLSAVIGSLIIAFSSAVMFYVGSSSGGTDIIALIIQKFSRIKIGKALLVTDVLIVVVGGILSGPTIAISSFIGLLIKTLGIDVIIKIIEKNRNRKENI